MFGLSFNLARRTALAGLVATGLCASQAPAVVLLDTEFTAAEGWVDGALRFQNFDGSGAFLGQLNNTTLNPSVDSVAGTVNVIGGFPPAGDAFLRNVWNQGATGGVLGGDGSTETGSGFDLGDKIKIDLSYQFDISSGSPNIAFFDTGVTDCFVTCGFEAGPAAGGVKTAYNSFELGSIKVFTNPARAGFNGGDNPFALFLSSPDIGINNGFNPDTGVVDLPTDFVSDVISFSYEAELVDDELDIWQATELVITNVDTETVLATASIDNPDALESFIWNATAVDDPFTPDVNEGGSARIDGSEMYFAARWIDSSGGDDAGTVHSARFEFIPINGSDPFPGDANGDGTVDLLDLDILGANFGTMGTGTFETGDFNGDGNVDLLDLDILGGNFGNTAPSSAIPEPTTVALVGFALAAASLRRRNG